MKGTEKQIKWATEIIDRVRNAKEGLCEKDCAFTDDVCDYLETKYAGDIIDNYSDCKNIRWVVAGAKVRWDQTDYIEMGKIAEKYRN